MFAKEISVENWKPSSIKEAISDYRCYLTRKVDGIVFKISGHIHIDINNNNSIHGELIVNAPKDTINLTSYAHTLYGIVEELNHKYIRYINNYEKIFGRT